MSDEHLLPLLRCPRVQGPVAVDGRVDRPPWPRIAPAWLARVTDGAPAAPGPLDAGPLFPAQSSAASLAHTLQPTSLRACWTDTHLLIAFQCLDGDMWGNCTRRDEDLFEEEVVEAFLCPTGDLRHYVELELSPWNVVFDAMVHSPDLHRGTMQVDRAWDCPGLETAVHVHGSLGRAPRSAGAHASGAPTWWSATLAVPFAGLPGAAVPRPGDSWRANFYRIDRAGEGEFSAWSPTLEDPPNFHVPTRFGQLVFVDGEGR